MSAMTPAEVYALARAAELDSDSAITATAIAWAESGLRPDAVGDVGLVDDKWGPSYGLYQVRSLWAEKGTGKERDADRLLDPSFNTRSMVAISAAGTNWTPWSVWKNGRYLEHVDAVRAAVTKGAPMELWHPRAARVQPADGHTGLAMIDVPARIVLHTTESDNYWPSTASYFGNPYWPHATITAGQIFQHLPINVGGYALAHEYGPETNRAYAIQCEIVWRAANADWPDPLLDTLADWVRWVQEQTGVITDVAEMFREGVTVASVDSPIRFGDQEWLDFNGICGHSNVPGGNDHWDPGRLPVPRLLSRLDPTPTPPKPQPHEEDDDTMRLIGVTNNRGIFLVGTQPLATAKGKGRIPAVYIGTPEEVGALADSGVAVRDESKRDLPEAVFNRRFVVVG